MGYAAAAVILILILAWLLMRMKIHLTFEYLHDKDNDKLTFKLSALYGLVRFKKTLPVIKVNSEDASIDVKQDTKSEMKGQKKEKKKITYEDVKQSIHRIEMILHQVFQMRQIGASFLAGVRVTKFEWVTVIGIKDAAVTGIAAGGLWAVKGALTAMLYDHLRFIHKPVCEVIPSFQVPASKTHLQCIFFFRFGHLIGAAFKLLKYGRNGLSIIRKKQPVPVASKNDSSV
ncbi:MULTISPECIES: DUF2953 domain-containing protein [Bacillus amyloliquefaciens group]|uniref:DUF2953 domain-containing protein n=1 Tax=Bacillus amyloliquefaciens group TaxID=1938374 RepID=UPI00039661B8|nr:MULTISPECIES: DUF2953 domain-containing protein [Bacillus amyloliquefaciens group]ATU27750.1 hypothetical protein BMJ37_13645 [Bacillus velezensis]AUS15028.1 DUF2953 domain-containing protein [Bacillus velezensis]ERH55957.1 hypothetical protein O205_07800 [Bacillus amyloliquefaciens EGD-AQ14]KAF1278981.1 hypothetical protein BUE72_03775 [Bacillus amyloliquefaciens]MCA1230098.1 DUF2953 domain-containing protein [Bacillus velezensis]